MSIEQLYSIYTEFPAIQTDSRKIKSGELYFALKGDYFDGHLFTKEALDKGSPYVIVDDANYVSSEKCILVDDVLQCLQALAQYHRNQFSIPFLAITGSNGKTTTKELMMAVLSSVYKTYATDGNLNNHIGVPLTILKIRKDAEVAIIEMGANHQNEISSYCSIALPTHALITNCGKAHLEGFGGIEGVRKGKGELYDFIRQTGGTIFRNADLDYLEAMSSGIDKQVTYGSNHSDYKGVSIMKGPYSGAAIVSSRNECSLFSQLVGEYNFANIMAAFAVGREMNIPVEQIKKAIEMYSPDNSRSQLIQRGTATIILDAYNANPTSMTAAIANFAQADYSNKIIMLGAMKELGDESEAEHEKIISLLEQTNWNKVVLVGGDFKKVHHSYLYFDTSAEAQVWFQSQQIEHTAFLIKGSRAFQMEKVIST